MVMPPCFTITLDQIILTLKNKRLQGTLYSHCSENTPHIASLGAFAVFGTNPTMEINDNSTILTYLYFTGVPINDQTKSVTFENWSVTDTTLFHPGQKVYCRLFPFNQVKNYFDVNKRQNIFVGQGQGSNVLSQVIQ